MLFVLSPVPVAAPPRRCSAERAAARATPRSITTDGLGLAWEGWGNSLWVGSAGNGRTCDHRLAFHPQTPSQYQANGCPGWASTFARTTRRLLDPADQGRVDGPLTQIGDRGRSTLLAHGSPRSVVAS